MRWCSKCRKVRLDEAAECPECTGPLDTLTEGSFIGWKLAGRYLVGRLLGRGGMAAVYEGEQLQLQRKIAVKIFLPKGDMSESLLKRFFREAQIIAKLKHPNIIEIIDFDVAQEGFPFLVMEFLDGTSLRSRAKKFPAGVDVGPFLSWMDEMCAGLDAAHAVGVIHRDLKPENVMLVAYADGTEHAKILDFGLAKLVEGVGADLLTKTGTVVGTPRYMAPEQIRGEMVDGRTDIYALGVIAFELLSGRPPFDGESMVQVIQQHLNEPPPDLLELRPSVPAYIAKGVMKALAKRPDERWSCVRELREQLMQEREMLSSGSIKIIGEEDGRPREGKPPEHAESSSVRRGISSAGTVPVEPPGLARRRSGKTLWFLISVVLLVLFSAATGAYLLVKKKSGSGGPAAAGGAVEKKPGDDSSGSSKDGVSIHWKLSFSSKAPGLSGTLFAGSAGSEGEVILGQEKTLYTWTYEPSLSGQTSMLVSIAGRADCRGSWWLVHGDRRRLLRLDPGTLRIAESVELHEALSAAVCLEPAGATWGYLVKDASQWVIFDAGKKKAVKRLSLPKPFKTARADPSGSRIALAGRDEVSIRDVKTFEEIFHIAASEPLLDSTVVAWSPSGRYLAFGFKTLHVYDTRDKRAVGALPAVGWIQDVGWIGEKEISVVDDRGRLYWTALPSKEWQERVDPGRDDQYEAFFVPEQNRWFLMDRHGNFEVFDYRSKELVFELPCGSLPIWSIAPHPTKDIIAVSGKDHRIALVDPTSRRILEHLEGHTDGIPFLRFAPSGEKLISAGDDGTMRVWDPEKGKMLQSVTAHLSLVNAFAMTRDERTIVSVSSDRTVKVWKMPEFTLVKDLMSTKTSGAAAAFSNGSDGKLLLSDWGGHIYLLAGQAPDWQVQKLRKITDDVLYMACPAPAGWWAVSIEGEKQGLWWIPEDDIEKAERIVAGPAGYCYSTPDGRWTAVAYPDRLELWDNGGREIAKTFRHAWMPGHAVAILPRTGLVMTGDEMGGITAWSAKDLLP